MRAADQSRQCSPEGPEAAARQTFETAIIERCRRREIEMYLAGATGGGHYGSSLGNAGIPLNRLGPKQKDLWND